MYKGKPTHTLKALIDKVVDNEGYNASHMEKVMLYAAYIMVTKLDNIERLLKGGS